MVKEIKDSLEKKVKKSIESFIDNLKKIRTGRASTAVLENIMVEYYGNETPLNQVASLTVPEARMIVIQPWDKSAIKAIERAIQKAELGFNPSSDGNVIRVVIPALTEETRKELVKEAKNMAEQSRVAVRNLRRDANEHLKKALKDHEITEDEEKHGLDDIQKITDNNIKEIDGILSRKEKEIMEI